MEHVTVVAVVAHPRSFSLPQLKMSVKHPKMQEQLERTKANMMHRLSAVSKLCAGISVCEGGGDLEQDPGLEMGVKVEVDYIHCLYPTASLSDSYHCRNPTYLVTEAVAIPSLSLLATGLM